MLNSIIRLALPCVTLLCNVKLLNCEDLGTSILNLPHYDPSIPNPDDDLECLKLRDWNGPDDTSLPPNLCGMCPAGEHDLEPCDCINNRGSQAGLFSIECGPSTNWTTVDEIKEMIASADDALITTHVFRFTMTGTNVSGALKQDVWGRLDFHQVILDNNQIQQVDNHAFANSKETLTLLSIKNNEITYFHWDQLSDIPHLYQLLLQGNKLSFIPSDIFPQTDLAYLDLSRNQIIYIGPNAFSNLRKLSKLNLSYNQLEYLDDYMFSIAQHDLDPNNLIINLSNNKISYISPMAFADVRPININLSYNRLTSIEEEVFRPIIDATYYFLSVDLNNNFIVCNCDIAWILLDPTPIRGIFGNFQCYDTLGNQTGTSFLDLNPHDFLFCHTDVVIN
ncbi:unnamed protein product [Meganyctiphanes norvegica]|uniref:Uncharacterized protein n=1 Tax=Meganyctiphanes norvegica TaxID=48144 RepID=A0AAV2QEZ3_MEGNR